VICGERCPDPALGVNAPHCSRYLERDGSPHPLHHYGHTVIQRDGYVVRYEVQW
jgi:hypothetical protein